MNVINDHNQPEITKPQVERVQQQKQEYKIIGSYYTPRGMTLFSFNKETGDVSKVDVKLGNTAHIIFRDGRLTWEDKDAKKTLADYRLVYFTSLNVDNAKSRVERFLAGKISELFNLKEVRNSTIKFY